MKQAIISGIALLAFAAMAFGNIPATMKSKDEIPEGRDVCLDCFADIEFSVEDCNDNETSTLECIMDSLEAASECTECVCIITNIFEGGDGDCVDPDPGVCTGCAEDIEISIEDCSNENATDIDCVIDIIGATSTCISCICEAIEIFGAESDSVDCEEKVLAAQLAALEPKGIILDCIECEGVIEDVVDECSSDNTTDIECIIDIIGAASDCGACLCDVLETLSIDVDSCEEKALNKKINIPATMKAKDEIPEARDVCLNCFADIEIAVEDCNDNETSTLACISESLDAASECTECICVIVNVFSEDDNDCEDPDPGVCTNCALEIDESILECTSDNATDVDCIIEILGATSECIFCICESMDIFDTENDLDCEARVLEAQRAALESKGIIADCIECEGVIEDVVDECSSDDTTDIECIIDIIGATSDCGACICDVLETLDVSADACEEKLAKALN